MDIGFEIMMFLRTRKGLKIIMRQNKTNGLDDNFVISFTRGKSRSNYIVEAFC